MATFREQVETQAEEWAERHKPTVRRSRRPHRGARPGDPRRRAVPDVSASPRHPDAPGATAGGSVMRQRMTNSPRWHSDTPHPMNGPQNGEPQ